MNELIKEINALEAEILSLKTASVKTGSQIGTVVQSTFLPFTFKNSGTLTPSERDWLVIVTPKDGQPMLATATVAPVAFHGRRVHISRYSAGGVSVGFHVFAYGSDADHSVIEGGGTVRAAFLIDVTASSAFNLITREASE